MTDHTSPNPVQLFYSYAHEDESMRKELEKHLSLLHRQGLLASWHNRDIQAGSDWKQELDEHLNTASLILLLISPDFLASNSCYEYEMQYAMTRRDRGDDVRVIPVILRHCDWQSTPFGKLQPLPRNGQPIATWKNLDEAFLNVEQSLRAQIELLSKNHPMSLNPSAISKNSRAMFSRLQKMYQNLLDNSLQEAAWIELGLAELPGAVQNTANLILRQAPQPPRFLPNFTSLLQVFQAANQELLILGAPGVGKSTLLYQLGRDLLQATTEESPFPVLFPLSTWSQKRLPIDEWMVEQLASPLYLVPPLQGQHWVQQERILPLLDGLDEMDKNALSACIKAINAYRRKYPLCPLVVCSRSDKYQEATSAAEEDGRLQLENAIEIQLLTPKQLDAILAQADKPTAALRSELKKNKELYELARTPLWLNILLFTFKDTFVRALSRQRSTLQKQVFELYVQRMVTGKGQSKRYPLEQTKRWLTFLARTMHKHQQSIFVIEQLQANWITSHSAAFLLQMSVVLIFVLIFGLAGMLIWGMVGLLIGLCGGLIEGMMVAQHKDTRLSERAIWSWEAACSGLRGGFISALFLAVAGGFLFGPVIGICIEVVGTFLGALAQGLTPNQYIDRRTLSPGEGLRLSFYNELLIGSLVGLFLGMVLGFADWQTFRSPVSVVGGVVGGLLIGLLYQESTLIKHFLLRFWLWRTGLFPFRIRAFLEDARARHLLRRIGGSYQFVHGLLLEYFAELDGPPPASPDPTVPTPSIPAPSTESLT